MPLRAMKGFANIFRGWWRSLWYSDTEMYYDMHESFPEPEDEPFYECEETSFAFQNYEKHYNMENI